MIRHPPSSTLFPYPPLFRSAAPEASRVAQATARPANPFPCESLGVAVSCTVCPSAILATAGLTVTEATGTVDLGAVDLSHETTNATATRTMWRTALWQCLER